MNCYIPPIKIPWKYWDLSNNSQFLQVKRGSGLYNGTFPFDGWFYHVVNHRNIHRVVPSAKGLVVTIVRKPWKRFRSAWSFFEHYKRLGVSLQNYTSLMAKRGHWKNVLFGDVDGTSKQLVGFDISVNRLNEFNSLFTALISDIKSSKWLALVADRLNESLLILAKAYGMKLSDILYFSHKVNEGFNSQCEIDNKAIEILTRVQVYDTLLYDAAVVALDDHIGRYGSSFSADLARFERALGRLTDLCGENSTRTQRDLHPLTNRTAEARTENHRKRRQLLQHKHSQSLPHVHRLSAHNVCAAMRMDHTDFVAAAWKSDFQPKPLPDMSFLLDD